MFKCQVVFWIDYGFMKEYRKYRQFVQLNFELEVKINQIIEFYGFETVSYQGIEYNGINIKINRSENKYS